MRISSPEAAVSLTHLTGAMAPACPGTRWLSRAVISLSDGNIGVAQRARQATDVHKAHAGLLHGPLSVTGLGYTAEKQIFTSAIARVSTRIYISILPQFRGRNL